MDETPNRFILEIRRTLIDYKMFLKEEGYWDGANHIFSNRLDDSCKNTNLLVDIFKDVPQILNPALTYSLRNIHSRNATDAKLVVNALAYIFYNIYDLPDMGIEQRDSIAQPLDDFLISQGWNNILKLNFIYQGEAWLVASKIVYLAGCSGKVRKCWRYRSSEKEND